MNKKKSRRLILGIILVLLIGIISYLFALSGNDGIAPNVYVGGVNVGNMSKDEAKKILNQNYKFENLVVKAGDEKFSEDLAKNGFKYNVDEAINEAYDVAKEGNFLKRGSEIFKLKFFKSKKIPIDRTVNLKQLDEFYSQIQGKVDKPAKNATISVDNGIQVIPGQTGSVIDIDKLKAAVKSGIDKHIKGDIVVSCEMKTIDPKVKSKDLKSIDGVIGEYSTTFSPGFYQRSKNIEIAASKVSNQLLMPGEKVSFKKTLGPITTDKGFLMAPVILNGQFVDGVGGGVCQVSSTLYNALLYSGVGIVSRSSHSYPSSYTPIGRDATIATDGPDLVYKNNYDFPIFIKTYAYGNKMVALVYGNREKAKNVKVGSEITGTTPAQKQYIDDPSIPKGKEVVEKAGRDGKSVQTYVIENGKKRVISNDRYASQPAVIRRGTGEVKVEPKAEPVKQETKPSEKQPQKKPPVENINSAIFE